MATRYKAKSGGKHPDLDMLDTMYDENEQVHTSRGAKVAIEASRAALDIYRLKSAPPADAATARAAVAHALGATLAAKVLKQASADEFDQLGAKFAAACREMAMRPGGDRMQVLKGAGDMIARMGGQTGGAGGSLGDDEKATKEARNDFDTLMAGVSAHLQRTGGHDI